MPDALVVPPGARPLPDDDLYPSGWFRHDELDALAEWARDQLVLELGTYLGRSTVAMARTARHVVTVDHFRGSPLENWYEPGDFLAQTRENLRRYGVERKVTVVVAAIVDLIGWFHHHQFDRILIDGAHDGFSVQGDTGLAIGCARRMEDLLWDDYICHWPDVMAVVDQIAESNGMSIIPLLPNSGLVALRSPSEPPAARR